ncbi:iron complex outermembrane recepter protein [Arenibacter nanhaiticus]|uniref:Iron complex outermembrane recepter protein n=1 Tax=Arenibacter nanhaiticus TaxID=558155 RepID=A0A1M6D791_9FLAO|nr:TonB-dependent receptor [Arenibacter nanhaiticus]SHI69059.1 iron complex outermembrane recepter protein [Arenibacter nanhaiticus]
MKFSLSVVLAMSVFTASIAQIPPKKDSITQLDEVILIDQRRSLSKTLTIPDKTIGEKEFKNYSPIDMVSAINQISGVYALSGALNTNRITIRGVGARTLYGTNKLRLYYNNIPVTNGAGFSTIESFDLENLSAIAVIKGPKSTSFGTNLGGAILLQTNPALENGSYINNNLTLGSYELFKNNLLVSHKDDQLLVRLQYGHLKTNGYRENNRFKSDNLLLDLRYQIDEKNQISLLFNQVDYTAQIPSSLGETAFKENPRQAAFTWKAAQGFEANKYSLIGLSYSHKFSEKIQNTTSLFYSYLDHYEPRPFGILDEYTHGYGFRTNFLGSFDLNGLAMKYSFGAELSRDQYNGREFTNRYRENNGQGSLKGDLFSKNKEFRRQLNTFGSLDIPFTDAFSAQLGINLNHTYYDYRDLFGQGENNKSAKREFNDILMPSATLRYAEKNAPSFYFNISKGFSNPSVEETLTPAGVINPDIDQETGVNYEIGSELSLLDKKLHMSMAIYRMDIKGLLVAQRVDEDQYVGKNAGKTKHQGLEFEASYQLPIAATASLNPFISYSFSDHSFVDFIDGDNDYSGNPISGVPKHRLTTGLRATFLKNLYWNTVHQYVGAMPMTDANTLSSDSFNVFNSKIGYQKQWSKKLSVGLSLGLNNVFDVDYAQSVLINTTGFGGAEPRYYYPGNGRNFYSGLQIRYLL